MLITLNLTCELKPLPSLSALTKPRNTNGTFIHVALLVAVMRVRVVGKLYVKLKISIDKAGGPRDLFKIFFNHFQYNKMLVLKEHKEQMLDMLKSANFNLPDSIRKQLDSMPEVAIKLRKENPLVEVNPDNYQHADQGPLWVINAKPMLQKQR